MNKDIQNKEDDYSSFIRDCLNQLKTTRICYVYNKNQVEDIKKRFNGNLIIKDNGVGYTLSVKRERSKL